jgi:AAA ATPase domain
MARQRTVASRQARRPPAAGGGAAPVGAAAVGRDDLLGRLRGAVDGAVAGRGLIVLLTGEAGIGKTTLLKEAARYAEGTGARPAWGSGWPGAGAPGYWPWIQVLRTLGLDDQLSREAGATGAGDAPASARFQLFDEVTSLLLAESRIQPVVVFLDDLQAADEPSVLLLDFLVRRLPAGALSVIGTYRGPDPGPALAAVAARAAALPLAGLPAGAVAQLMADVLGEWPADEVAAAVHRRTGGNPFFVQQVSWLLKTGQTGIPPGVREALTERFAALSTACTAALGAAAVIGGRFRADLVARTLERPPEPVAEALAEGARAGVLTGDAPGAYLFGHDLFREFAYERLPVGERARLHLRTGRQLEADRARGGDVQLAELAGHFVQADPGSGPAYQYSAAAAREADGRLAYEEAARHWERALAAAGADRGTRTGTLLALARARWRMGAGQAAGETYLAAAGLARRERDAVALARAALGLHEIGSRIWWPAGQLVTVLSEALDALTEDPGATPLRLRVMAGLARVLAWHGLDLPRARALAAEAVTQARAAGDVPVLAACLLAQHNAVWAPGTAGERRAVAAEVAALAGQAGDRELLIEAHLLAATDLLELADPAFRAELDQFAGLADATGQPRYRYATLARRAMLALLGGHFAEADRLIGQAAALGEECGEPGARDVRHDQDWDLRDGQGRLGELAGAPLGMFPDPDSPQARGLRALALLAAGDRAQAAQVAGPMFDVSPDLIPRNHQFLLGTAFAAELVAGLSAGPAAGQLYQALLPFAGQAVVSGAAISFHGAVAHHLGVLAAALGRPGEAAAHLERAVAVHERLGARPWALRSRCELARLRLAEPGQRDAAAAALAGIGAEAEQLGMAGLARDAQAHAVGAGHNPLVTGMFRREGALWTLAYGGVTVRMRDAKGLADLVALLAAPGREIPAADLVTAGSGGLGRADLRLGADEVLDETARRQIRRRLADLDEEIAEADAWADPERASRARAERDALVSEVTAATGLAGRARRLGDQDERARKAVTARIRYVIGRIERVHPSLAAHLRASVTTGTRCCYSPPTPASWQL